MPIAHWKNRELLLLKSTLMMRDKLHNFNVISLSFSGQPASRRVQTSNQATDCQIEGGKPIQMYMKTP